MIFGYIKNFGETLGDAGIGDPVTLRFSARPRELRYGLYRDRFWKIPAKLTLFGAAIMFGLFGILDSVSAPEHISEMLWIRFGLGVFPLMVAAVLFDFPRSARFRTAMLAGLMTLVGGVVIYLMSYLPIQLQHIYLAGLVTVLFCCVILRLPHMIYFALSCLLWSAAIFVLLTSSGWNLVYLVADFFFMFMSVATGTIAAYMLEIASRFGFFEHDTSRKQLAVQRRLHRQASAASNAKSAFLATMSHELRTPLNAIIGFSQIMDGKLFGDIPEKYVDYVKGIESSGRHLLTVINDVLDLAKAEANAIKLFPTALKLRDLGDECVEFLRARAEFGDIVLSCSIAPDLAVNVDPDRMRQVLLNIMSNAVKFTGSGGTVTISARITDAGIDLSCTDTGIGIDPALIPTLMQPFTQADNRLSRVHEGTGLGLSIAKRLTELHDGSLEIVSALGKGTIVTIALPSSCIVKQPLGQGADSSTDSPVTETKRPTHAKFQNRQSAAA